MEANWWDKPVTLGGRVLAPLIGAGPDEVLVGDSTSINTFKVAVAALRLRPDRRAIVTDRNNFPTDLYMIGSAAELCGQLEVRVVDDPEGSSARSTVLSRLQSSRTSTTARRACTRWQR